MKQKFSYKTSSRSFVYMLFLLFTLVLGIASFNNHTIPTRAVAKIARTAAQQVAKRCHQIEVAKKELVIGKPYPISTVYFMPDDKLIFKDLMLGLIHDEKFGIDIAAFTFNYKPFADAILDAAQRGVKIRIVADGNNAQSPYSKVAELKHRNIARYVFRQPVGSKWEPLMHHKFMIFKSTLGGRSFLEKGSFNFSQSALNNQENAEITSSKVMIQRFSQQFELLIKRSKPYKAH